jgi:hypothetical protein
MASQSPRSSGSGAGGSDSPTEGGEGASGRSAAAAAGAGAATGAHNKEATTFFKAVWARVFGKYGKEALDPEDDPTLGSDARGG